MTRAGAAWEGSRGGSRVAAGRWGWERGESEVCTAGGGMGL